MDVDHCVRLRVIVASCPSCKQARVVPCEKGFKEGLCLCGQKLHCEFHSIRGKWPSLKADSANVPNALDYFHRSYEECFCEDLHSAVGRELSPEELLIVRKSLLAWEEPWPESKNEE
jgi:hypothetical protein